MTSSFADENPDSAVRPATDSLTVWRRGRLDRTPCRQGVAKTQTTLVLVIKLRGTATNFDNFWQFSTIRFIYTVLKHLTY